MEPTPAGEALLVHARITLRDLNNLESEIVDFTEGVPGNVRIPASESALFGYFPDALRRFTAMYPQVRIDLSGQTSAAVVQSVSSGSCDLGIYWGDVPTNALRVTPCYIDRLVLVAPMDQPLAAFDSLKFTDVLMHEGIEQEPGSAIQSLLADKALENGMELRSRIRAKRFRHPTDCRCSKSRDGLDVRLAVEDDVAQATLAHVSPAEAVGCGWGA